MGICQAEAAPINNVEKNTHLAKSQIDSQCERFESIQFVHPEKKLANSPRSDRKRAHRQEFGRILGRV
jgi:hypothetical protein